VLAKRTDHSLLWKRDQVPRHQGIAREIAPSTKARVSNARAPAGVEGSESHAMNSTPHSEQCAFLDCPSHRSGRIACVVRHSRLHTKRGIRQRRLCKTCGRTFLATTGTIYHRLRHKQETLDRAVAMSAQGVSKTATARSLSVSWSTVDRWLDRAATHMRRFSHEHVAAADPVELQIDEVRASRTNDYKSTWIYSGIEVWSRLWTNFFVGRRTKRSTLLFVRGLRDACCGITAPTLVTSDGFKYYAAAMRKTMSPTCAYVQIDNRYARDRIVRTESRLVLGGLELLEQPRARSEDSKKPNTSYVERLNLFVRRGCCYLHRRTTSTMRSTNKLESMLWILYGYYNFIRPHSSLRFGKVCRTPAMQAGILDRALSFREIFKWRPPPETARSMSVSLEIR
jgi:transposase-like protein/IS1 family transposase